jgi:hypothetical protein
MYSARLTHQNENKRHQGSCKAFYTWSWLTFHWQKNISSSNHFKPMLVVIFSINQSSILAPVLNNHLIIKQALLTIEGIN